jgi:hypothetical protein
MTGMWSGFGIGAAIGVAGCVSVSGVEDDVFWWSYPLIIGMTTALGAGTGALIGALIPKWKTLYEAPKGPPLVANIAVGPSRRGVAMTLTLAF